MLPDTPSAAVAVIRAAVPGVSEYAVSVTTPWAFVTPIVGAPRFPESVLKLTATPATGAPLPFRAWAVMVAGVPSAGT